MSVITSKELKKKLNYNPKTGIFKWRYTVTSRAIKDSEAGWHTERGYIRITINKHRYPAHRLAWLYVFNEFPQGEIDHINHNKGDNRIINLRVVTRQENSKNLPMMSNNTSGHTGVYWNNNYKKWVAELTLAGKKVFNKAFKQIENAIVARERAEIIFNFHKNNGK